MVRFVSRVCKSAILRLHLIIDFKPCCRKSFRNSFLIFPQCGPVTILKPANPLSLYNPMFVLLYFSDNV